VISPLARARDNRICPHNRFAIAGDGEIVYRQACQLGCEGIVSKRLGSLYRSGRSRHWVKVKNSAAPAVRARRKRIGAANATRAFASDKD
jgi:ATP-dependent DNA ligase